MPLSSSGELKLRSKARLRERIVPMMMIAAVFIIVNYLLSYLASELSGVNAWNRKLYDLLGTYGNQLQSVRTPEELEAIFQRITAAMPDFLTFSAGRGIFGPLLSIVVNLMSVPLAAGYSHHILTESRRRDSTIGYLTHGFRLTFKLIAINILTSLLVTLGFILFIVPSVMMIFRYSMAVFCLLDDPDLGPVQAMRRSAEIMRGHKWRLFKVEFSFFFWLLASSAVTNLIGAPVLNVYLTPYITLTEANFYNELIAPAPTWQQTWSSEYPPEN